MPSCVPNSSFEVLVVREATRLSGTISDLGNCEYLRNAYISKSGTISGTVPSRLMSLTHMTSYTWDAGWISGSLPPVLNPDTNGSSILKMVSITNHRISGVLHNSWSNLQMLSYLYLYEMSKMSGTLPHMGNLSSIRFLMLGNTSISGSLPDSIGTLTDIKVLSSAVCYSHCVIWCSSCKSKTSFSFRARSHLHSKTY